MNKKQAESSNVKVAVRVRPFNKRERHHKSQCIIQMVQNATIIANPRAPSIHFDDPAAHTSMYTYDYSYWSHDISSSTFVSQEHIFNDLGCDVLKNVYQGYNCSILAYGQTGCFAPDTIIPLFNKTTKKVQDISVGDILIGDDRTPRIVQKLFKGQDVMYDIVLETGYTYRVNSGHLLVLRVKTDLNTPLLPLVEISVQNYTRQTPQWKDAHEWVISQTPFQCRGVSFQVIRQSKGDYCGFMIDKNHRFLGQDMSVLRNSGKTFTMTGDNAVEANKGLIPRICEALFAKVNNETNPSIIYQVEISYLEIYAEQIRDLINSSPPSRPSPQNLRVREHPETGPYVEGLTQVQIKDYNTMKHFMARGNKRRTTASTNMNDRSSRSHAVFTVYFKQTIQNPATQKLSETTSKIQLVDLAGSERIKDSGVEGIHLKEAVNINKSLTTLGRVINALAKQSTHANHHANHKSNKNTTFVPFRDSTLTWLLKDSLGGNSKTFVIATVSPADINYEESHNTLQYASHAKKIVNTVCVNADRDEHLIRSLKEDVAALIVHLESLGNFLPGLSAEAKDQLANLKKQIDQGQELMTRLGSSWEVHLDLSQNLSRTYTVESLARRRKSLTKEKGKPMLIDMDPGVENWDSDVVYNLEENKRTNGQTIDPSLTCEFVNDGENVHLVVFENNNNITNYIKINETCIRAGQQQKLISGDCITTFKNKTFKFRHPQVMLEFKNL